VTYTGNIVMTNILIHHTKSKSMELKKHVAIIHSSGSISLLQRKIANALLFHAYENLLTQDEHVIHLPLLTKLIGYDSHDYKKIKKALMDLLATVIEWNIVDGEKIDKEGIWNASSLIADVSIQGAICTYSYSNKMRQLLYHPSVYGRLSLEVQSKFQSSYGLALYENCNRYQDIGQTPLFELDKFRKLMGVEQGKYVVFRDFKTRVLNKAVEEINKYSPLKVEAILKKVNRQVVAVQFLIKKPQAKSTELGDIYKSTPLNERLKNDYGLSHKQIQEILKKHDENYINEKINIIELSSSYQAGKIKNLGKYLLCALEDNYQNTKNSTIKLQKPNDHNNVNVNDKHQLELQKHMRRNILERFSSFDKISQGKLREIFANSLNQTLYSKLYKEDGLNNVLIEDQWVRFLITSLEQDKKILVENN
jgi:plasmid replication initiation protein